MRAVFMLACLFISFHLIAQQKAYNDKKANRDFKFLLNKNKNLDQQLEWSGFYCWRSEMHFFAYWQKKEVKDTLICNETLFFFQNGLMATSVVGIYGMDDLKKTITDSANLKKYRSFFEWGTYDITNDTIRAIIFKNYSNSKSMLFSNFHPVHYQGIIRNKNIIIDWHALPPFLKTKHPVIDITPSTLVFKPLNEKKLIDSSKAWVNKYRN